MQWERGRVPCEFLKDARPRIDRPNGVGGTQNGEIITPLSTSVINMHTATQPKMASLSPCRSLDLPPSDWSKIWMRFGNEGGMEWREVEIVLAQGGTVADACHRISVTEPR
jgi:hypothetical protein